MASSNSALPTLVFVAAGATGHVTPPLRVAAHLVKKGYNVLFLTTPEFQEPITRAGAEWLDLEPIDMSIASPEQMVALLSSIKHPLEAFSVIWHKVFLAGLPKRTQQLRSALELLHSRDPNKQVIIVYEVGAMAVHPFHFGSPLPKGYDSFPKTICLGVNPVLYDSVVSGFGLPGFPFEDSPAVRARNQYIFDLVRTYAFKDLGDHHTRLLRESGCTEVPPYFSLDDFALTSDVFLQLGGPSFEYPDDTRNSKIKFAGTLPPQELSSALQYPNWWPDVVGAKQAGKKVVLLAQGTLEYPPEALLLPAISALADEPDILLIVAIGIRGSILPAQFQVPGNTRVVDYFPYDAILPYTDVFVFNAGYGGASHAIGHGVPIVTIGELGQEKPEVAARIEWSGLGLVVRSPAPWEKDIRNAVKQILEDGRFKEKALALQKESIELDPFAVIENQVKEFSV